VEEHVIQDVSPDLGEIQAAIETLPEDQQRRLARWLGNRLARARAAVVDREVFFRSPALLWSIVSLLAFLAVEAAAFRSGWYNRYLQSNSSAGMVESYLFWLSRTPPGKVPEVMVIGDSRIAEGFSSRTADASAGNRIHFWNFGIGGTEPRIWYYILRDADPTRRRFQAIVLALDYYADEDTGDSTVDHLTNLNYVIGRLRLTDCPDFAFSMMTREARQRALAGCLLKGITLRRDLREFLSNIRGRITANKDWRDNGLAYVTGYSGVDKNLNGLTADFAKQTIAYPPGLDEHQTVTIRDRLMPPAVPQLGKTTRYREQWLGRIIDLYKDSPTKIIFLEVPRAPLPRPESRYAATFLNTALKRPNVLALPSSTFRYLEKPELFFDGLHLNKDGRQLFSAKVGESVPSMIGIQ
jgi:hypothetical protein